MPAVYADILNSLTEGLYNRVDFALREYLQNGYDAIKKARSLGLPEPEGGYHVQVKLTKDGRNITVSDNGVGMDRALLEDYTSIGGGTKVGTTYAGHKGIGKLSGLRFFEHFVVRTKTQGSTSAHELTWRSGAMLEALLSDPVRAKTVPYTDFITDYVQVREIFDQDPDLHYTQVQLCGVLDDFRTQVSKQKLVPFIRSDCPVPFFASGFQHASEIDNFLGEDHQPILTFFNEDVVYRAHRDSHELVAPVFVTVKYSNEVRAKVWFSWNRTTSGVTPQHELRGIRFRCKGICVGDEHLFANECMPPGRSQLASWFVGEVVVLDEAIKPSTARDSFQSGSSLIKFQNELRARVGTGLSDLAERRSELNAGRQQLTAFRDKTEQGEVTPSDVQKLRERRKVLARARDNNGYTGLDFGLIDDIDVALAEVDTAEPKDTKPAELELEAALENGETGKIIDLLLDIKSKQDSAPSKVGKKKYAQLLERGKAALIAEFESNPSDDEPEEPETLADTVKRVLVKYLDAIGVEYDEDELAAFVQGELND